MGGAYCGSEQRTLGKQPDLGVRIHDVGHSLKSLKGAM